MPTLYELADAREILDRLIAENDGELTPELEAALDASDGSFSEKVERCALWIREQMANADAIKSEEERLAKRRHALVNGSSSLRAYVAGQMQRVGKEKVHGTLVTVTLMENALKVEGELSQEELLLQRELGEEWVTFAPAKYGIDQRLLNRLVRDGMAPPAGMRVADTTTYITIR